MHTNTQAKLTVIQLDTGPGQLCSTFYVSHLSDSTTEHRDRGRKKKKKKRKTGREKRRHSPGQAQPPTDIFSHVGLCSERNSCTQSTRRCSHGLTLRENKTGRGVERLEGVVQSRACTAQLHSSLSVRGRNLAVVALAASLIGILQHKWEGK